MVMVLADQRVKMFCLRCHLSSCRCVWISVARLYTLVCAFLFTIHLKQVHDTVPHASLVYYLDIGQFACVGGAELDLF